jgi:dihydroneopterin aldolase
LNDPSAPRIALAKVFVRGLTVAAEIGLHAHERGHSQPLIIDVELELDLDPETASEGWRTIDATVNYEHIAEHARAIAGGGHIGLVETYAWRLAEACLAEPGVTIARVKVAKLLALAPDAQAAGVEIVLEKR